MAVLALSAVVPALASARVTWATNYVPVSKSTAIEWSGKLKIVNSNVPYTLECAEKAEGTVGANGNGEVTKLTMSSCVNIHGCGGPNAIVALNLPWHTELISSGGTLKNVLTNGGKGNPTFKTECTVIIKVVEECTASTLSTTATNGESGVTATFNGENLNCTLGGAGVGKVEGSQTVVAPSKGTLSAQAKEPVWLKNGVAIGSESKATNWNEGNLALYVSAAGGPFAVSCEESGQGTASAEGAGEITKLTLSKCKKAPFESSCNGEYSLEAKHLPWKTELYYGAGGVIGESFVDSGAGAPDITLKCHWGVSSGFVSECSAIHLGSLTNNTEHGVLARFSEEGIPCSGSTGGKFSESSHKINLVSGETLTVS